VLWHIAGQSIDFRHVQESIPPYTVNQLGIFAELDFCLPGSAAPRRPGILDGLPMQNAHGHMVFPLKVFAITVAQLLKLLDGDELHVAGVCKLMVAQNCKAR